VLVQNGVVWGDSRLNVRLALWITIWKFNVLAAAVSVLSVYVDIIYVVLVNVPILVKVGELLII